MGCRTPQKSSDTKDLISEGNAKSSCTDPTYTKFIAVNIHFMLRDNGTGNFTEINDGDGDGTYNGYNRAEALIKGCNDELAGNPTNGIWRTTGVPVLPKRYRYALKGVYFHRDSRYNLKLGVDVPGLGPTQLDNMANTYGVDVVNTLNVFLVRDLDYVYDVNNIRVVVEQRLNGLANNRGGRFKYNFCSDYGMYYLYKHTYHNPYEVSPFSSLISHEIGHNLSLAHTWDGPDDCDDTPQSTFVFPNGQRGQCSNWIPNPPNNECDPARPCTCWSNVSNNFMDYNGNQYHAWTPCQIARVHADLDGIGNPYVLTCNKDCCFPSAAYFDLTGCFSLPPIRKPNTTLGSALYLEGTASTNEDAYYIEIFQVANINSLAPVNLSAPYYYSSSRISGQVGRIDLKSIYSFSPGEYYRVLLTVENSTCNSNTPRDMQGRNFYIDNLTTTCDIPLPEDCEDCTPIEPLGFFIAPNPASNNLVVGYKLEQPTEVNITLCDNLGNQVLTADYGEESKGDFNHSFDLSSMRNGIYHLVLSSNGKKQSKTFLITH
jgi:Secretion system C-terminal sorting domain/Pregnancy-associated plasma protein-A